MNRRRKWTRRTAERGKIQKIGKTRRRKGERERPIYRTCSMLFQSATLRLWPINYGRRFLQISINHPCITTGDKNMYVWKQNARINVHVLIRLATSHCRGADRILNGAASNTDDRFTVGVFFFTDLPRKDQYWHRLHNGGCYFPQEVTSVQWPLHALSRHWRSLPGKSVAMYLCVFFLFF